MTPAPGIIAFIIRLNAPRGLKLPECCNSSSFNLTGNPSDSDLPSISITGECRICGATRLAAAAISERVIMTLRTLARDMIPGKRMGIALGLPSCEIVLSFPPTRDHIALSGLLCAYFPTQVVDEPTEGPERLTRTAGTSAARTGACEMCRGIIGPRDDGY